VYRTVPKVAIKPGSIFHSDNALITKQLEEFCATLQVSQTSTPPYTPQLNPVPENYFNVILGKVRAMLFHAQLPAEFWVLAWKFAEYMHDRSPHSAAPHVRPIEEYGQKLSLVQIEALGKLPPFGAPAFVSVPSPGKLDVKARRGIFVGVSEVRSSAMVFFYDTKTVVFTVHVRFGEIATTLMPVPPSIYVEDLMSLHVPPAVRPVVLSTAGPTAGGGELQVEEDALLQEPAQPHPEGAVPAAAAPVVVTPPAVVVAPPPTQVRVRFQEPVSVREIPPRAAKAASTATAAPVSRAKLSTQPTTATASVPTPTTVLPPPGTTSGAADIDGTDPLLACAYDVLESVAFTSPPSRSTHSTINVQDAFCAAILVGDSEDRLPRTYLAALQTPQAPQWEAAMAKQMAAFKKYDTFKALRESDLLPDDKPLYSSVVFKHKYDVDNVIEVFKTRLVVDGSKQKSGLDFVEADIHSPVASMAAGRLLLSTAAASGHFIRLSDIEQAFLQGNPIKQRIVVRLPRGVLYDECELVLMQRASFGLRQAPMEWYIVLKHELVVNFHMIQADADPCVFVLNAGEPNQLIVSVIVDDLTFSSPSLAMVEWFEAAIRRRFNLSKSVEFGLTPIMWLGMQAVYDRENRKLTLSMAQFIDRTLARFDMVDCTPTAVPMAVSLDMRLNIDTAPLLSVAAAKEFQSLVGTLIYIGTAGHLEISIAVSMCAQFMSKPNHLHEQAAKDVLRYLKGARDLSIVYQPPRDAHLLHQLISFADASFGGEIGGSARSYGGHVILCNNGPVLWASNRQKIVTLSTCEAETVQLSTLCRMLTFMHRLSTSMAVTQVLPMAIMEDNTAAIQLAGNSLSSARTRHMHVKDMHVREKVSEGLVKIYHCPTTEMLADIFTKPLDRVKFRYFRDTALGITPMDTTAVWFPQELLASR
jgi:hypothetical protein